MAGDWIKMTHELPEKPEVLAISGKTGANRLEVVGRLFILWRWFDQHTIDGNARSVTRVTLSECLFGLSADTKFVDALIEVGWLCEQEDGISVVNFDAHISESAKQRALTAKRVAKSKGKGNGKGNSKSVTGVTPAALPNALPREDIEKKSKPPIPPVDGLNLEAWDRWVEYRIGIKKPIKAVSMPSAQRKLAEFGSFQALVVEQSIANGWQGLFDLKTASGVSNSAAAAANTGDWREKPLFKGAI